MKTCDLFAALFTPFSPYRNPRLPASANVQPPSIQTDLIIVITFTASHHTQTLTRFSSKWLMLPPPPRRRRAQTAGTLLPPCLWINLMRRPTVVTLQGRTEGNRRAQRSRVDRRCRFITRGERVWLRRDRRWMHRQQSRSRCPCFASSGTDCWLVDANEPSELKRRSVGRDCLVT